MQRPACKGGLDRQCGTFAAKWSLLRVGSVAVAVVHKPSPKVKVAPGFVRTFTLNKMCINQCGLNTHIFTSTAVEGELGSRSMDGELTAASHPVRHRRLLPFCPRIPVAAEAWFQGLPEAAQEDMLILGMWCYRMCFGRGLSPGWDSSAALSSCGCGCGNCAAGCVLKGACVGGPERRKTDWCAWAWVLSRGVAKTIVPKDYLFPECC